MPGNVIGYRLPGPLEVAVDGTAIDLGGLTERACLPGRSRTRPSAAGRPRNRPQRPDHRRFVAPRRAAENLKTNAACHWPCGNARSPSSSCTG